MLLDSFNLIVEQNGSGGDSAHYSGLYTIASKNKDNLGLEFLVLDNGYGIRHPGDGLVFWHSNPNTFTRDQLMPLIAGLYEQGRSDLAYKLLITHARRFFFCQNIDRDIPGSVKKPYPHYFVDKDGKDQFSWFNYRDPLLIHHIHAMMIAAGLKWHWVLYPLSMVTFSLEALSIRLSTNYDIGTLFATGYVLGFTNLFKKIIPDWKKRFSDYFLDWRRGDKIYEGLVDRFDK